MREFKHFPAQGLYLVEYRELPLNGFSHALDRRRGSKHMICQTEKKEKTFLLLMGKFAFAQKQFA